MSTLEADREVVVQALDDCLKELAEVNRRYQEDHLRVHSTLNNLRKRYNTLAPISQLPHELIALIFEAFVAEYWVSARTPIRQNGRDHSLYKHSMCGWLVILRVCQHWRAIALDTPSLWTRIELSCEPFVRLALEHAKDLPLKIYADQGFSLTARRSNPYMNALGPLILPAVSRIRSARLCMSSAVSHVFFRAQTSTSKQEADLLESLTLIVYTHLPEFRFFSDMTLPRLSTLKIIDASIQLLTAFLRTTLTTLSVAFHAAVTPNEAAAVLEQLPLLQHLELFNIWTDDTPLPQDKLPPWCRTISLPHLAYISIKGTVTAPGVVHLWACLDFPATTQIEFTLDSGGLGLFPEVYEVVSSFVLPKAFGRHIGTGSHTRPVLPRVVEVLYVVDSLSVVLWSSLRPLHMTGADKAKAMEARRLHLTVATNAEQDALRHLFQLLDLSEVAVMDIEEILPADAWVHIFAHRALPKLQELTLHCSPAADTVLSAMSAPLAPTHAPSASPQTDDSQLFLFPALKMLTLSCCLFRRRWGDVSTGDALPEILRTLRLRSEHGYKLEVLVIEPEFEDPSIADFVDIEPVEEDCSDDES
ncbi:hypothetical protein EIP86_010704 [Pleurotus ostreatoroseus]|nr:hypothetical protein EIP86_010704 [Pleurotus ostreatoroseus]